MHTVSTDQDVPGGCDHLPLRDITASGEGHPQRMRSGQPPSLGLADPRPTKRRENRVTSTWTLSWAGALWLKHIPSRCPTLGSTGAGTRARPVGDTRIQLCLALGGPALIKKKENIHIYVPLCFCWKKRLKNQQSPNLSHPESSHCAVFQPQGRQIVL